MLRETLERRPEVADVALTEGCVDAVYYLAYCKNLEEQEDIPAEFSPERAAELLDNAVSAALGLYQGEDSYTMLHDSFGLTLQEIRTRGYMTDQEIAETCGVPEEMLDCDMAVRDVLHLDGVSGSVRLSCDGSDYLAPLAGLKTLSANGQEEFAPLLDARVADIQLDNGESALVLEGVEAAELERLHDVLEAQGQTMGPAMG